MYKICFLVSQNTSLPILSTSTDLHYYTFAHTKGMANIYKKNLTGWDDFSSLFRYKDLMASYYGKKYL